MGMDQSEKARFILQLHKHSLQAFDSGGTVLGGPGNSSVNLNAVNPNQGLAGTVGGWLGLNNNFQAGGANIQGGTNTGQLNNAYAGAQSGIQGQQNFANQAAAQGGFGNQSNVFAQQQALANQLSQQAQGQGPNPAQAALNQSTGQNVANQAALMASQRGAGSNPALIARQAALQGAGIQQQAVGQGATLQAQQQLAAQSALANQQAQLQGVAGNQIAAQGQGANNVSSAQQNEQNVLQGANTAYNNAAVNQQGNINNVNAQTAAANQKSHAGISGMVGDAIDSIGGGIGSIFSSFVGAATGGMILPNHLHGVAKIYHPHLYGGGDVSPDAPQYPVSMLSDGGALASSGGKVKPHDKSEKAVKKGDSSSNDKVPTLLSAGEVVLPRSVTMHKLAPQKAAEFMQAVMNKRKMGGSK